MVSAIHDNVNLVLEVKNLVEFDGEISISKLTFKFLNRAGPIIAVCKVMKKPKERRYIKVEVPILDKISSLGIIKLLALDMYGILIMKVKFERINAFLR